MLGEWAVGRPAPHCLASQVDRRAESGRRGLYCSSLHPCPPPAQTPAHPLCHAAAQGRDDLGRPLLQRALRIQEAHLGPDHPDVQAIRDVLLEEEGEG